MANYFVSPGAGSDATGDGSIGNPWKSVQYALDNITQGASGDEIHVQAGAADVLSAGLSLATYGTPGISKPLTIRGYTSAARDGGRGEISGGGSYPIYKSSDNSNKDGMRFVDMKLGNCGSAQVIHFRFSNALVNCELHSSTAANAVYFQLSQNVAIGCLFHSLTGDSNVRADGSSTVFNHCTFISGSGIVLRCYSGAMPVVWNCMFILSNAISAAAMYFVGAGVIANNTIYSAAARGGPAIFVANGNGNTQTVVNNIVAGYSGTGGVGLSMGSNDLIIHGGNAFYNCATAVSNSSNMTAEIAPNITLASDPFVNAAGGDYRVKSSSLAAGAAWPQSWPGLPNTGNARDIGAAQNALTTDYPLEADVRLGVDYAEAAKTGTLAVPVAGNVRAGVAVDNITGTLGIPTAGNVRSGVQYGAANTEYTGVLELPLSGNVLTGVQYGASGTEYTGTMPQTLSIGEGAVIDIIDDLITVEVND